MQFYTGKLIAVIVKLILLIATLGVLQLLYLNSCQLLEPTFRRSISPMELHVQQSWNWPRSTDHRLRNRERQGLLDDQELMGSWLGREGILQVSLIIVNFNWKMLTYKLKAIDGYRTVLDSIHFSGCSEELDAVAATKWLLPPSSKVHVIKEEKELEL